MKNLIRRTALGITAAAVAATTAVAGAPGAVAAGSAHSSHAPTVHAARSFDNSILKDTNKTRKSHGKHHYAMNHKLWKIAHTYALYLAKTGKLVHNPKLEQQITKVCPAWNNLGENIGYETGSSPHEMFEAYMHSPPHKANLLEKSYRQVGIASVQVTRNGVVQQWNVMDFANHCH